MGSGDWFKTIIGPKKVKASSAAAKSKAFKLKKRFGKVSSTFANGSAGGNNGALGMLVEGVAATRIQTAFRAYKRDLDLNYVIQEPCPSNRLWETFTMHRGLILQRDLDCNRW